jgi:glycosyltransferase involved in cell wall biosynthesis
MSNFVYSVAIRSVKDNDFLRRTLQSLLEQTILPDEIVIAIPEDIQPWETGIKEVRFVQTKRGAVTQRSSGISASKNKYLLLLDDDIILSTNISELLLQAMIDHNADCIIPYWKEGREKKGLAKALLTFFGIMIPQSTGGVRYTSGAGFYYPEQEPPTTTPWKTEGGAGAVLMVNKDFCIDHHCIGDELFQKISAYAFRDDGAFVLDISRNGGNCLMLGGISFIHLGGTTRLDPSRLDMAYRAQIYNSYLFWKNYIEPQYRKSIYARFKTHLSILWYLIGIITIGMLIAIRAKSFQPIRGILIGLKSILIH